MRSWWREGDWNKRKSCDEDGETVTSMSPPVFTSSNSANSSKGWYFFLTFPKVEDRQVHERIWVIGRYVTSWKKNRVWTPFSWFTSYIYICILGRRRKRGGGEGRRRRVRFRSNCRKMDDNMEIGDLEKYFSKLACWLSSQRWGRTSGRLLSSRKRKLGWTS